MKIGPTQQGLPGHVRCGPRGGDKVAAGDRLFDQDDTADRAASDQAARQLKQAEAQLANLQAGGKPTEIQQAAANLAEAQAARDKTQTDLQRYETLLNLKSGAVSQQSVDQQRADLRSAEAKVAALEAALAQMRAPLGRDTEIEMQRAAIEVDSSAARRAQWRLDQRHVVAPVTATVADVIARPGETLAAGAFGVLACCRPRTSWSASSSRNRCWRSFIAAIRSRSSATAARPISARTISFIAPQVEYTPPVIYSESSRAKLVIMVEARPRPDQATLINPGQPIVVRPLTPGPAR